MLSSRVRIPVLALAALLVAGAAAAQPSPKSSTPAGSDAKGYTYDFPDDALLGDNLGASGIRINVRPKASRATLVRPRLSFVPEMLKSVESL